MKGKDKQIMMPPPTLTIGNSPVNQDIPNQDIEAAPVTTDQVALKKLIKGGVPSKSITSKKSTNEIAAMNMEIERLGLELLDFILDKNARILPGKKRRNFSKKDYFRMAVLQAIVKDYERTINGKPVFLTTDIDLPKLKNHK